MAQILNVLAFGIGGVALLPLLQPLFAPQQTQLTTVRLILGQGVDKKLQMSGNVPGVSLWDRFGEPIGTTFGTSQILGEGASVDITISPNPGVGNVPAEYISITNGGDDAICVTGFSVAFADGSRAAWTADVAAACTGIGAKVSPSSRKMVADDGSSSNPFCVWIDRDASFGIPHQGFGVHLPDFGNTLSPNQTAAYLADDKLMCQSGPRFRMYGQIRAENPILVFKPPIQMNADGTDLDPGLIIDNPGTFASQDKLALFNACASKDKPTNCDVISAPTPIKTGIFNKRTEQTISPLQRIHQRHLPLTGDAFHNSSIDISSSTDINVNEFLTQSPTTKNPSSTVYRSMASAPSSTSEVKNGNRSGFQGQLIISSQNFHSAKAVCDHPNSIGPSFATLSDGWFCDMVEKKLYPICTPDGNLNDQMKDEKRDDSCCFDVDRRALGGCVDDAVNSDTAIGAAKGAEALLALGPMGTVGLYTDVQHW